MRWTDLAGIAILAWVIRWSSSDRLSGDRLVCVQFNPSVYLARRGEMADLVLAKRSVFATLDLAAGPATGR